MDYTAIYNDLLSQFNAGTLNWVKFKLALKTQLLPYFNDITDTVVKKGLCYYLYYETAAFKAQYLTIQEIYDSWSFVFDKGLEARTAQWKELRKQIGYNLSGVQVRQFVDISDREKFEVFFVQGGLPIVLLWSLSSYSNELGYNYTNNGFNKTSFYNEERLGIFVDVLINGNY